MLFQMLSRPVSLLVSFTLLAACSQAPVKPAYRGLPENPVAKSFKIQLAKSESSLDEKSLSDKLAKPVSDLGCAVDSVQKITWEPEALSEELSETYHLTLKDCDLDKDASDEALVSLSEEPYIEAIEAEANIKLRFTENDPGKRLQTHLPQIARDEVCDLVPENAPEIVVAVIDSGVERNHPDLVNNFAKDARGEIIGANFVGKGSRFAPDTRWDDQNGHGTHVAGIVAATGKNGIGITGVASCANVKIMPIRVMGADGSGSSIEIDRGVQWAIAKGADIINLSLGSTVAFRFPQRAHPNALYNFAAQRGVMVFAAAGNESLRLGANGRAYVYSYPASYDHVISVAALDSRGRLASFSNRGETVDIAAPGVEILSTYPGRAYKRESGTSMASPVAAGAFALALSLTDIEKRPSLDQVEEALLQAVTDKTLSDRDVLSEGGMNTETLVEIMSAETK